VIGHVDSVAEPRDVPKHSLHPYVLVVDENDTDYAHAERFGVTC
jgi:hypothetical protein